MNNPPPPSPGSPRNPHDDPPRSATPGEAAAKELGIPEKVIVRGEDRWVWVVGGVFLTILVTIVFSAIHIGAEPPSNVETINPLTAHQPGSEFVESNLGSGMQADGTVVVRVLAQQYAFVPSVLTVPVDTPVVIRATSADVVHGFLVMGTNVNTMIVPGYVATLRTRFTRTGDFLMPCHEFCGASHHAMWARVHVVPKAQFPFDPSGERRF